MSTKHTEGFKEQAVQKAFTRDGKSVKTIAQELNIGYSTLQKWIREYKLMNSQENGPKRPQNWNKEQQLQALMDTALFDDKHLSQYCREKGIFPHHLAQWRENFIKSDQESKKSNKVEIGSLKKEIGSLQKEIRRKDKALAETAALLVLQKKFQALLEERDV